MPRSRRWILPASLLIAGLVARTPAAAAHHAARLDGHWTGAMNRNGKTWNVNLDVKSGGGKTVALVDLVDYGIYALPFTLESSSGKARLERKQPGGPPVVFEGTVAGGSLSGEFAGLGVTAPFALRRTTEAPAVLREEEVKFANGDVTLAGTILIPAGTGPHPALVCTHGAGAEGRERGSYHSNGYFFARLGFVTLIYDKRGVGGSTGDFQTASVEDLADDALAGLHLLQGRKDVRRGAVGITGVSQGGWIAPSAAVRSPDVAFVLVISPSGINPMDQSDFSVVNAMKKAGDPPEAISRAADLRRRMYALARTGSYDAAFAGDVEQAHGEPWFARSALPYPVLTSLPDGERRFLLFEPVPVWEKVRVPVLALWGEDDSLVPAEKSKDLVARALAAAKNDDVTLKIFPHADHTLSVTRAATDDWDFPRAAEGSRKAMADWLVARAGRPHS
jgi:pimeloyl-ACP methyl ester carboxylesterase